jgi:hypothetical protein
MQEHTTSAAARRVEGARETHLDGAELASRLEAEDTEGGGDDHLLLAVVRGRHTLKELEALQGSGSTGGLPCAKKSAPPSDLVPRSFHRGTSSETHLVGNHSTDSLVEDPRGSTVMEGTGLLGVDQMPLVQELVVSELWAGKVIG